MPGAPLKVIMDLEETIHFMVKASTDVIIQHWCCITTPVIFCRVLFLWKSWAIDILTMHLASSLSNLVMHSLSEKITFAQNTLTLRFSDICWDAEDLKSQSGAQTKHNRRSEEISFEIIWAGARFSFGGMSVKSLPMTKNLPEMDIYIFSNCPFIDTFSLRFYERSFR